MRRSFCLLLASLSLLSCTTNNAADAGAEIWTYQRPPVPDGAILLETPEFEIPAASEQIYCTFTDIVLTQPFDTRELHSYQAPGGHHAALFYVTNPHTDHTPHVCTEQDMADLRVVGAGIGSFEQVLSIPQNLAIQLPVGSQLVVQSHYLNTSTSPMHVKDAVVALRADPSQIQFRADGYAISDGDMQIPPHSPYGRTLECTVDQDTNMVNMIGHTHQYGTRFRVELIPNGSTTPQMLYDEPAGIRLQFSPPQRNFDPPLALHTGDRLRVYCDWNNTSGDVLGFPSEMCAMFSYYYPGRGFLACTHVVETRGGGDAGVTSTNGNAGCSTPWTSDQPCIRDCNTGNEIGVGRYCTAGGNQCRGNHSAIICTADVDPSGPGFCTKPCSDSTGCGSGTTCVGDSAGMGCVPNECLAPDPTDGGGADASDDVAPSDAGGGMDASAD